MSLSTFNPPSVAIKNENREFGIGRERCQSDRFAPQ
jgi:hypothetical protein